MSTRFFMLSCCLITVIITDTQAVRAVSKLEPSAFWSSCSFISCRRQSPLGFTIDQVSLLKAEDQNDGTRFRETKATLNDGNGAGQYVGTPIQRNDGIDELRFHLSIEQGTEGIHHIAQFDHTTRT